MGSKRLLKPRIEIPVSCAGAVKFARQAQFHPLKFMRALSEKLTIYERYACKGSRGTYCKDGLWQREGRKDYFCHSFSFRNFPGMYFTRMHQERSYVLALEDAGTINGMYIGDGKDTLSFRQFGQLSSLRRRGTPDRREERGREI